MVRDTEIWWPWFDGCIEAQRAIQGNFDADWLQRQTFELMKARTSYHRLPQEAFAHDPAIAFRPSGCVSIALRGAHPLHVNDSRILLECERIMAADLDLADLILATVSGEPA